MKTSPLNLIAVLTITLLIGGCSAAGPEQCPVNADRAKTEIIPISQAKQYRTSYDAGLVQLAEQLKNPAFLKDSFNLPQAEMFNRDAIGALLNVEGADGVRIYLGRDNAGQIRLVLLPVDKNGKDIITRLIPGTTKTTDSTVKAADDEGEAIENGQRCPTMCDGGW